MAKAIGIYTISDLNDGANGRDGQDGKNAIQMLLSNENHTLPANADGVVTSYSGASTTVKVFEGSTDVTSQYTIARTATTGITTTLSSNVVTVTNVTQNTTNGTVTITATKGGTTLTKIFTISISKDGPSGASVSIDSQEVKYQIGTSPSTPPTGTWQTSPPTLVGNEGKYLWTRTIVNYSNSTSTTSYSVSYIAQNGTNGTDGVGISSTEIRYQASSSGTVIPTGTWELDPPPVSPSNYLWTRTTIHYTNNTSSVSYSVGMMGATGSQGPAGASAKLVKINPSTQMFKSTTGASGTFLPQYIYLYPTFQNCSYSKWQYSTNGTSWTDVTSGTNSLTIATYGDVDNSLRIERTCRLFTDAVTAISFKCKSNDDNIYDTVTVVKVYDVTDIEVGGRNFLLGTNKDEQTFTGSTTDKYKISDFMKYAIGTTDKLTIRLVAKGSVAMYLDAYFRSSSASYASSSSFYPSFHLTTEYQEFTFTGVCGVDLLTNNILYLRFRQNTSEHGGATSVGTVYIKELKLEAGTLATTWTPAPEDTMSIIASPTEPLTPEVGLGWYNTTTGDTFYWDGTSWTTKDLSNYATITDVNAKNSVFIEQPTPPYYVGDIWIVQDENSEDYGKMKTCTNTRLSGSYVAGDWFTPLTAYTTVTDTANLIGIDPSEWSTTTKSITTLINEANSTIASVSSQAAQLAVRASGIEMSFSITGTMNFLGNSSGQNSLQLWSLSRTGSIQTATANEASDVRSQLVSGSAFYFNQSWGSSTTVNFTSDPIIPPTGDNYTISFKLKNQSRYSIVRLIVYSYSTQDASGSAIKTDTLTIPYAANSYGLFFVEHMVLTKPANVARIKVRVSFIKPSVSTQSSLPTYNANYMGSLYKVNNQGYWGASEYAKITIIEQGTEPSTITPSQVWKCTSNIYEDNNNVPKYVAGMYYEKNTAGNLVVINDSYAVTMLDKDNYYKRVPTAWEQVTVGDNTNLTPSNDPIYFGDIMVNGGQMVQTWTPRQDENLWGDNIKFSSAGITIENKGTMTKRQLDESSDISYVMNTDGSIKKILWKLTSTGFIVEDILCKGEFSMGYVPAQYDGDNDHIVENFRAVTTLKRNSDNTGVDEYIYVNNS